MLAEVLGFSSSSREILVACLAGVIRFFLEGDEEAGEEEETGAESADRSLGPVEERDGDGPEEEDSGAGEERDKL